MINLQSQEAATFCSGRLELMSFFSGPAIVIEILGNSCYSLLKEQISKFDHRNVYISGTEQEANTDLAKIFNNNIGTTVSTLTNCTCCVIRPHCFIDKTVGLIINDIIENGFMISGAQLFRLNKTKSEEFLEVYRGVLPEFTVTTILYS